MARSKWLGKRVTLKDCTEPCDLFEVTGEVDRLKIWVTPITGIGYPEPAIVRKQDVEVMQSTAQIRANQPCPGCGEKRAMCVCLERRFLSQARSLGLPEPEEQFIFDPERKWRADFCFVDYMVIVEVEGGSFRSRHREAAGFERDAEKYNRMSILGYSLLRFTGKMIKLGTAVSVTEEMLRIRGWTPNGVGN